MKNIINTKQEPLIFRRNISNKKEAPIPINLDEYVNTVVTEINDENILLKTDDDIKLKISKGLLDASVGDYIKVTLKDSEKVNYVTKRLEPIDPTEKLKFEKIKQDSYKGILELFKENNLAKTDDDKVLNTKFELKNKKLEEIEALQKIKRNLNSINGKISPNVINQLVANGLSLEKIDISLLSSAIEEINEMENVVLTKDEISDLARNYMDSDNLNISSSSRDIVGKLISKGVLVTEKNISSLEKLLEKSNNINPNEKSILYLLNEEKDLTLENIYKSQYNSFDVVGNLENEISNEKIGDFLTKADLENTSDNRSLSRTFINNNIPISKNNFERYRFLSNYQENVNRDFILDKSIDNLKNEKSLLTIKLYEDKTLNENIKDDIKNINEFGISNVIDKKIPVTINNLKFASLSKNINADNILPNAINTTKNQLSEIQLKLTQEAMTRLSSNNIKLDNIPIQNALDTLRAINNGKDYTKNLRMMNTEVNAENLGKISTVFDKVSKMRPTPYPVYKDIIENKEKFSINNIASNKVLQDLENFETKPIGKFGDTFNKLKPQISEQLLKLGLAGTEENIEAYSILSKNNMETNLENLEKIKVIDSKIDKISENLNPNIAAKMIKEGFNPVDMHVDEVIEYIEKFKELYGRDRESKIEEYILQMDKNKELDNKTRESMIAVYRMLNKIQKDGSVSLGVALKNNTNLTLGNLMEASKYYESTRGQKEKFDIKVDENFGERELLKGNNIRSILENNRHSSLIKIPQEEQNKISEILNDNNMGQTASNINRASTLNTSNELTSNNLNRLEIANNNVDRLINNLEPDNLEKVLNENRINENIENVIEQTKNTGSFVDIDYQKYANEILRTTPEAVAWLDENSVPVTINNISVFKNMLSNPNFLTEEINSSNEIIQVLDNKNDLLETEMQFIGNGMSYDDILKNMSRQSEMVDKFGLNQKTRKHFENVQKIIDFQRRINNSTNTGAVSFPIKINDKISNLNLHFLNEDISNEKELDIFMSLETTNLGNVQVDIDLVDNKAVLTISSDDINVVRKLESNKDILFDNLKNEGIIADKINFSLEEKRNLIEEEIDEKKKLYKDENIMKNKYSVRI